MHFSEEFWIVLQSRYNFYFCFKKTPWIQFFCDTETIQHKKVNKSELIKITIHLEIDEKQKTDFNFFLTFTLISKQKNEMSYQNFKTESYSVGARRQSSTKDFESDITKTSHNTSIGKCV